MNDDIAFTIPLTRAAHQFARENGKTSTQIYLNRLAVFAVNYYLDCFAIETELKGNNGSGFILELLGNVSRLMLKNIGNLECHSVLEGTNTCKIPFEVRDGVLGYVAVQIDRELKEAKPIGFLSPKQLERFREVEDVPLAAFDSVELLYEHLQPTSQEIHLSEWLNDIIDAGWETVERFFQAQQPTLAMNFRGIAQAERKEVEVKQSGVKRWKLIDLERAEEKIALFVGLKPKDRQEMDIEVEVYPSMGQTQLPKDLQLMILDEAGEMVMHAKARQTQNLHFDFSGDIGENFGVKLTIGDVSFVQSFLI
ncbi:DUF1822 family protein [Lusitaniella coriacea LEGE 07157]|uniref:DUF1822 family protein n=1 Tax=Lusitaniella coriacea LEGE 07157 TaxID=945747 RepID=A0A8J7J5J6_9CYAN|nr:DUF1822 family protein [Lusitaniella coriacea]MBE9118084.1 DUF1822 family protein [Lusitaniella coriacea LEGE 07157]